MLTEKWHRFFGIPHYWPRSIYFLDEAGHETCDDRKVSKVIIDLERTADRFKCGCGRSFDGYYDRDDRFIRDLPWGPWRKVELLVPRYRVMCPDCGVRTEPLEWLMPKRSYTRRLAEAVARACREVRSISAIADAFNLDWHTVKEIDREALERELNPPDFSGLRRLVVDEIAIHKGHRYATVFLDADRTCVLWLCETREKDAVKTVFTKVFGPSVCAGIEAVAMDWWEPYEEAVRDCLPNAQVVWDLFHVISKYNREVVDRVRLEEARRYRQNDPEQYRHIKGSKWILFRNPKNLQADEPARLADLLRINRRICYVHILAELLRQLWEPAESAQVIRRFRGWHRRALHSGIEAVKTFANKLRVRLHGILAHAKYPLHTGVLEGVNNKIKVIKRVAYGFRDTEYFFLKIRAHYAAIP